MTAARPMTREERRRYNQAQHAAERQQWQARRGPAGVAAAWWDHARAVCRDQEAADPGRGDAAWNDLARTLEHWASRYGQ